MPTTCPLGGHDRDGADLVLEQQSRDLVERGLLRRPRRQEPSSARARAFPWLSRSAESPAGERTTSTEHGAAWTARSPTLPSVRTAVQAATPDHDQVGVLCRSEQCRERTVAGGLERVGRRHRPRGVQIDTVGSGDHAHRCPSSPRSSRAAWQARADPSEPLTPTTTAAGKPPLDRGPGDEHRAGRPVRHGRRDAAERDPGQAAAPVGADREECRPGASSFPEQRVGGLRFDQLRLDGTACLDPGASGLQRGGDPGAKPRDRGGPTAAARSLRRTARHHDVPGIDDRHECQALPSEPTCLARGFESFVGAVDPANDRSRARRHSLVLRALP